MLVKTLFCGSNDPPRRSPSPAKSNGCQEGLDLMGLERLTSASSDWPLEAPSGETLLGQPIQRWEYILPESVNWEALYRYGDRVGRAGCNCSLSTTALSPLSA